MVCLLGTPRAVQTCADERRQHAEDQRRIKLLEMTYQQKQAERQKEIAEEIAAA